MTDVHQTKFVNGGEPHQQPLGADDVLTTNHGVPVSDNQNSLKAGKRGPTLLEDFVLREKIFHFDHERIPERIVHARGRAHGVFEATDDISDLSRAAVFTKGEKTEVFVRFSTVTGGAGSVDTPRDVRGFAVKFYTRRQLGPCRQQHSGVLHPRRDQVSRPDPFGEDGSRSRLSAGGDCS
jgi:catalase